MTADPTIAEAVLEGEAAGAIDEAEAEAEAWPRREAARLRQVLIGKARPEYRRYVAAVRPERRSDSQPRTPDHTARVSKRQFDRALGEWRRRLHELDSPTTRAARETARGEAAITTPSRQGGGAAGAAGTSPAFARTPK